MIRRTLSRLSTGPSLPLIALFTAMLSLTIGASIAKSLFPIIGAAGTTALRLSLAAIMLAVVFRIWRGTLSRQTLKAAIPYGVSLGMMNLLFYMAIQRIPLGIAVALEFSGPLSLAVLSSRRMMDLCWVVLACSGLFLLLPLHGSHDTLDTTGMGFALGAAVCWAAYILTGKQAGTKLGAAAPALGMLVGSVVVLPFGLAQAGFSFLTPHVMGAALIVAVLSSALPYSLEMFALRRLPAKSFGVLTSGEPAIAAMTGAVLLGESLSLLKIVGIGAVIAASIGITWSDRDSHPKPE
ncbi:EamA family transporter [Acetobacter vaccinii]|uniref:DMT family transporter n=1 Tax=Acetobacter vaccinii TaxID=2592655 RepID=A0A5C1YNW9_9PROT|nr:DMT family transporter [Acetobacter vaccinii]QEO16889.1 DMT family transporter [Acetobacter vaccinii]